MRVSVVIPTLNEAERIERTLRRVQDVWPGAERIVVDGGSTDDTVTRAQNLAQVLESSRGRARQMRAGADAATGDLLLFLHADTLLPGSAERDVLHAVSRGFDAGVFRLRFDRRSVLLTLYGWVTRLPWIPICFGDRGLFVTRAAYDAAGGFSDLPMFEDLDLARRLDAAGRFGFLGSHVTTASRRFVEHGILRQQVRNTALWSAWMLGVAPDRLTRFYGYRRKVG